MAVPQCPACTGAFIRSGVPSRASGRRIAWCADCGARFWSNPESQRLLPAEIAQTPAGSPTAAGFSKWVAIKREKAGPEAWRATAGWLRASLAGQRAPRLYDVGAGDGQFLKIARDEFGFAVTGNDVVKGAVDLAAERYGVSLEYGDLSEFGHEKEFDAVTLWCVLAHVEDGDALLRSVHRMLREGGLVALQTPHWTGADALAYGLQNITRGRVAKLPDRRMGLHHRILHTVKSITAQLERLGFAEIQVVPQRRYSLTSYAYLVSMNPPAWTVPPAAWLLDRIIRSRFAPRIVLDVRARRA